MERRTIARPVEIRAEGDTKARTISGYGAVYYVAGDKGTEYQLWSDVFERIAPGAFDRSAREDDIRALFNHDPNLLLGRTKSGTLEVFTDAVGFGYRFAENPADPDSVKVAEKVARGDADGSSFSFAVITADWTEETVDGQRIWIRTLKDVRTFDVGPVTFPAYEGTTSGARSIVAPDGLDQVRQSLQAFLLQGYSERDAVEVAWRDIELRRARAAR